MYVFTYAVVHMLCCIFIFMMSSDKTDQVIKQYCLMRVLKTLI